MRGQTAFGLGRIFAPLDGLARRQPPGDQFARLRIEARDALALRLAVAPDELRRVACLAAWPVPVVGVERIELGIDRQGVPFVAHAQEGQSRRDVVQRDFVLQSQIVAHGTCTLRPGCQPRPDDIGNQVVASHELTGVHDANHRAGPLAARLIERTGRRRAIIRTQDDVAGRRARRKIARVPVCVQETSGDVLGCSGADVHDASPEFLPADPAFCRIRLFFDYYVNTSRKLDECVEPPLPDPTFPSESSRSPCHNPASGCRPTVPLSWKIPIRERGSHQDDDER